MGKSSQAYGWCWGYALCVNNEVVRPPVISPIQINDNWRHKATFGTAASCLELCFGVAIVPISTSAPYSWCKSVGIRYVNPTRFPQRRYLAFKAVSGFVVTLARGWSLLNRPGLWLPSTIPGMENHIERGPPSSMEATRTSGSLDPREVDMSKMVLHTAPVEASDRPMEAFSALEPRCMAQFRYRILVVDDDPSVRETAQRLLESQGYEILAAADGLDALLVLSKSLPDVIISDLHMPRMSGFELLTIVRQRFPRIAIVAMSGGFVPDENLTVIMADAFWQKGQPIKTLFQEIKRVLAAVPARPERERSDAEPLLVQRSNVGHLIVTCPKCLRASKLEAAGLNGGVHETVCSSCRTVVQFEINQPIAPQILVKSA